jgi:DNA-binding response OmpR family regulator
MPFAAYGVKRIFGTRNRNKILITGLLWWAHIIHSMAMRMLLYDVRGENAGSQVRIIRQSGIRVDVCADEESFFYRSLTEQYSAVLVRHDGLPEALAELYSRWRLEGCSSLFAVLTPQGSAVARARALELGVDLYYMEPCSYVRLLDDIVGQDARRALRPRPTYRTRWFELDVLSRTARLKGVVLRLTRIQFDLLAYLLRSRGSVVSRLQIWEEVWGHDEYPLGNTVDVHVYRLRQRLGEAGDLICAVQGIGYRMHEQA